MLNESVLLNFNGVWCKEAKLVQDPLILKLFKFLFKTQFTGESVWKPESKVLPVFPVCLLFFLQYRLETYTETRASAWQFEPYNGKNNSSHDVFPAWTTGLDPRLSRYKCKSPAKCRNSGTAGCITNCWRPVGGGNAAADYSPNPSFFIVAVLPV